MKIDAGELTRIDESGEPKTTSLKIGECFGKEHGKVLRAIENLECSEEFRQANFGLSSYVAMRGKTMPMYEITRDGFSFLAMGFTGKKAAVVRAIMAGSRNG